MENDDSSSFGDSILLHPDHGLSRQTKQEKIELRRSYRKLIEDTTNNKDELVKPNNDGLMQNIAKAQELFKNVQETREGALDSRFMTIAVTLGAQKTSRLQTDLVAFQPDEFVHKLVSFMEGSIAADDADDVSIPEAGWEKLGKTTAKYFKSLVPAIHPLLGVFDHGPSPKQKPSNNKVVEEASGKTQLPQQLTNYRTDQKEATPEEIERVYKIIKGFYEDDPTPIDYFELVTNPDSYGHTVENIFHLAFLVKDGLVKVFLNDNGIPVVELVGTKESAMGGKDQSKKASTEACSQVMVSLSMQEWQDIVDAYQLKGKQPFIAPSGIGK